MPGSKAKANRPTDQNHGTGGALFGGGGGHADASAGANRFIADQRAMFLAGDWHAVRRMLSSLTPAASAALELALECLRVWAVTAPWTVLHRPEEDLINRGAFANANRQHHHGFHNRPGSKSDPTDQIGRDDDKGSRLPGGSGPELHSAMSEQYSGVGARFQKHAQAKRAGLQFVPGDGDAGEADASTNAPAAGAGANDGDGIDFGEKRVVEGFEGSLAARRLMQDVVKVATLCGARGAFTSRPGGAADPNPSANRTRARTAAAAAANRNDGSGDAGGSGVAARDNGPAR